MDAETKAAQLCSFKCNGTGAFVPPIHFSTTYFRDSMIDIPETPVYGRSDNPTFGIPESVIASLELGADCLLFPSGMAAASTLVAALGPGARILAPIRFYAGIWEWLTSVVSDLDVEVDFMDFTDVNAVEGWLCASSKRVSLLWIETPTTPSLDVLDILFLANAAKRAGALVLVDNTAATPVLTRPIALGADIVLHSATKALNGHDDVISGVLVARERNALWERVRKIRNKNGVIPGPFDSWLLGRGLRTIYVRVRHACYSAALITNRLMTLEHPCLAQIIYPGQPDHPGHSVACKQMSGLFGNMISLRIAGGEAVARRTMAKLRVWRAGTSFGGVQSMLEHRASIEANYPPTPPDLLRLSVGLEAVEDLVNDLLQALEAARHDHQRMLERPLIGH